MPSLSLSIQKRWPTFGIVQFFGGLNATTFLETVLESLDEVTCIMSRDLDVSMDDLHTKQQIYLLFCATVLKKQPSFMQQRTHQF